MSTKPKYALSMVVMLVLIFVASLTIALARETQPAEVFVFPDTSMLTSSDSEATFPSASLPLPALKGDASPAAPAAPCTDSVSVGGHALNECQGTTFSLGGDTWTVSVYYTLDTSAGNHWIITHTEAANIVPWMQEAMLSDFDQSGRTYGASHCDRHIRAKIQVGGGWSGIAWWPNSCYIGLDSQCVRGGGCRGTTFHEIRHKFYQFAYDDCLDDWKSGYPGNREFTDGDADYGRSTRGDYGYFNNSLNPNDSMYDHGYGNRFIFYYTEKTDPYIGPFGSPGDPDYLAGGMVRHMELCESYDDLYVERELVETYTPYTYEEFFLNYVAANYLHPWSDSTTQPELYYFEADAPGVTVTAITPDYDDSLSTSVSYTGESTPDSWAAQYYQFRPQAGCDYVMLEGDGQAGAKLGWAFMAADTSAPSAEYSGWVGENFARTFAGDGAHNRVTAGVAAFSSNYSYDISARCVIPEIEIVRPLNPNHVAYVGDPLSPVAFMAYIRVTSGGEPVTGIPTDWFELDAEGDTITATALYEITKGNYLGVFTPPTKAVGTTWVDLRACLQGTGICDTNTEALLYVAPGNIDMVLLHDASASMIDPDVPGDLSRLDQAKNAAELLVMLARVGDYYGIMDFSARDDPAGCAPDCPHDTQVVYPKTEITDPASQIPLLQTAISGMTAREWTNLGQGLVDAQLMVLGTPYSINNKVVAILSDGEENVNPMYDDISSSISVIVDTWGFSGDAPSDLLTRIAAEKGGNFLYVPTSPGSSALQASRVEALQSEIVNGLRAWGAAEEQASAFAQMMSPASTYLPGGLALNDAYEYLHTEESGGARVAANAYVGVAENEWKVQTSVVSAADNTLVLVSSSKEADYDSCAGWHRDVEVRIPGSSERDWIPVSPPGTIPGNFDVRDRLRNTVVYVNNPLPGTWYIRTRMHFDVCNAVNESIMAPQFTADYIQTSKVYSTINLEGEILLENRQGRVGEPVPLLGTVLTRMGAAPGAAVLALVERPGADAHWLWLRDDGLSNDGAANDGLYGNTYHKAVLEGPYNVTIGALGLDPSNPSQALARVWRGSFYMEGDHDDLDDDRMPWWWEAEYRCMNPKLYDNPGDDYDNDGASNWTEWLNGTNPCDPDTDDGGERDGSEISNNRNPHWPNDDKVRPFYNFLYMPINQGIVVKWTRPLSYTMVFVRVEDQSGRGNVYNDGGGQTGVMTITLDNDVLYYVSIWGENEDGQGSETQPQIVTPKADPDPPSGFVLINNDAETALSKNVSLYVNSTDVPIDGLPTSGAVTIKNQWNARNEVSADIQMRFANNPAGTWSPWEPYVSTRPWALDCNPGEMCFVYSQFKDGAENESDVFFDSILLAEAELDRFLYLPLVLGNH